MKASYTFDPSQLRPGQADVLAAVAKLLLAVADDFPPGYAGLLADQGSGLLAVAIRAGWEPLADTVRQVE